MKLLLFISHNGGGSRRKAFDHIMSGDVTVGGAAEREPSREIDPLQDEVRLLGKVIKPKAYEYIMLNKPAGYVTTCETQFDQRGVLSLLPPNLRHLKPVGRLDKDTQGLLVLTNDGELANRLAHPSFDVNKTYHVRVVRRMEHREKDRLEQGVVIDKFRTAPAEITNMTFEAGFTEFDLTIHEGHKRQVRLMCHEVGHEVVRLTRISQGPLKLDTLKSGAWRALTGEEQALLHAIGRTKITPLFKSHPRGNKYPATRDWHSEPLVPGQQRPRREYKPRDREDKPRGESAPRREYKPYKRDESPRTDRPRSEKPSYAKSDAKPYKKPFGKKPFAKKPFAKKSFSRPQH
jgi:23S rRNA pseudouridine2605 synthase